MDTGSNLLSFSNVGTESGCGSKPEIRRYRVFTRGTACGTMLNSLPISAEFNHAQAHMNTLKATLPVGYNPPCQIRLCSFACEPMLFLDDWNDPECGRYPARRHCGGRKVEAFAPHDRIQS